MSRPRGRTKTARLTVNLDPQVYSTLLTSAQRDDVPLACLIRRAVNYMMARQHCADGQPELPIGRQSLASVSAGQ